ncbi:MAG: 2-deoxyribose-5-phosphate aldolase, partial [Eubacteriales bacterium]|nr:2-deoxyribose-5-phosphate aldolase [Eubacteriales bacterium]
MTDKELCGKVDHTLLKQTATWEDIQKLCDEAIAYQTASVCIPPCYVAKAHDYVQGKMTICTVIGFPNGNHTTETKEFEIRQAIADGATELDMVINIGMLKAGNI